MKRNVWNFWKLVDLLSLVDLKFIFACEKVKIFKEVEHEVDKILWIS